MNLALSTWVETEEYLKSKNALIFPVGSTEQHGVTGLLGTDYLTSDAIALEVGRKLKVAVAPPFCYGMASHHMAFAGSAALRPSIYQAAIAEILRSFYQHGFRRFYLVNGHGGNVNSLGAVFQELKAEGFTGASFSIYNWWKMPEVSQLATELYGEKEGFHATPSEVSLTYYLHGISKRSLPPHFEKQIAQSPPAPSFWPMTAAEIRKYFPTGAMKSDPTLASAEDGKRFFEVAVESISKAIQTQGHAE